MRRESTGCMPDSGLLLLDIFINDLEENITSPLIKFAADTKIRGMAQKEEERALIQDAS